MMEDQVAKLDASSQRASSDSAQGRRPCPAPRPAATGLRLPPPTSTPCSSKGTTIAAWFFFKVEQFSYVCRAAGGVSRSKGLPRAQSGPLAASVELQCPSLFAAQDRTTWLHWRAFVK